MFGATTPNLQKIAIRILSQPSSASGCERSWSMFEHIHSKRRNRLAVQRLNDLVFVHYNLRLRIRQILGADSSPIILEEIDPESEWITETVDPVFTEEDRAWVDQVDVEAEAVAKAEEAARARSGIGRRTRARTDAGPSDIVREPIAHAGDMARRSSRTYLTRLSHRQTGYSEAEVEAATELEDDDEDDEA